MTSRGCHAAHHLTSINRSMDASERKLTFVFVLYMDSPIYTVSPVGEGHTGRHT
jgi:hypothetical protein